MECVRDRKRRKERKERDILRQIERSDEGQWICHCFGPISLLVLHRRQSELALTYAEISVEKHAKPRARARAFVETSDMDAARKRVEACDTVSAALGDYRVVARSSLTYADQQLFCQRLCEVRVHA